MKSKGPSPLIIISGPTASGKTSFSIKLAQKLVQSGLEAEVVNFDSILFYDELNIGSAKPSLEERQGIEHHLIGISKISSALNASDYIEMAEKKINELHARQVIPILVGGSAFYLRALIKGMYESTRADEKLQSDIKTLYESEGIAPFLSFLKTHDPQSHAVLHQNDHYRIMRAYEHFKMTGQKISEQKKKMDELKPYDFSVSGHPDWGQVHLYLDLPKEDHWGIIQKRTKQMFDMGLIQEVTDLKKMGYTGQEKPLQSIGYKEAIAYLDNDFNSIEDCMDRVNISTRQLAKAQRTFFNKVGPKTTFNPLKDESRFIEHGVNQCLEISLKGKN